jgi:hypothetical protein
MRLNLNQWLGTVKHIVIVIPATQESISRGTIIQDSPDIKQDLISKITNTKRAAEWLK